MFIKTGGSILVLLVLNIDFLSFSLSSNNYIFSIYIHYKPKIHRDAALHWPKNRQNIRYSSFWGLMLIKILENKIWIENLSSKFSFY